MIINTNLGTSFVGAIGYVLDESNNGMTKNPELISSNLLFLEDNKSTELASQFNRVANLNSRASKVVWHTSISFSLQDNIDNETMGKIAKDYLNEIGFSQDNQFIVAKHNDTQHQHFHIIANRIDLDGKAVKDSYLRYKQKDIARKLEIKYNLQNAEKLPSNFKTEKRQGVAEAKRHIISAINHALIHPKKDFNSVMKGKGIDVLLHKSKTTDRIFGMSFSYKGIKLKGSQLGKQYAWKQMEQKIDLIRSNKTVSAKTLIKPSNVIPVSQKLNKSPFITRIKSNHNEEEEDDMLRKKQSGYSM